MYNIAIVQDPNDIKYKILSYGLVAYYIIPFVIELVLGVKMYRFVDKNLMKTTERVQELQRQFTRNLVIQVCHTYIPLDTNKSANFIFRPFYHS